MYLYIIATRHHRNKLDAKHGSAPTLTQPPRRALGARMRACLCLGLHTRPCEGDVVCENILVPRGGLRLCMRRVIGVAPWGARSSSFPGYLRLSASSRLLFLMFFVLFCISGSCYENKTDSTS